MSRQAATLFAALSVIVCACLAPAAARGGTGCTGSGRGADDFVEVDEMPAATRRVAPAYPEAARRAGASGTVFVRAHVDGAGHVDEVQTERVVPARIKGRVDGGTLRELHEAALCAVRCWSFRPAHLDGRPVAAWITVPVTFDPAAGRETTPDPMPQVVTRVEPVYPREALRRGIAGTVVVRAFVGRDGHVRAAMVAKSVPELDQAALDAVKKWTFRPTRDRSGPVEAWLSVPVTFVPGGRREPWGFPRFWLGSPRLLSGDEVAPIS